MEESYLHMTVINMFNTKVVVGKLLHRELECSISYIPKSTK
ncbi:hypothetical protein Q0N88_19635 [Bacillus thuringiensis]